MDKKDEKEADQSQKDGSTKDKSEVSDGKSDKDKGGSTGEPKEGIEVQDGLEPPNVDQDGSSEASEEIFGGGESTSEDPTKTGDVGPSEMQDSYDEEMIHKVLRCLTSSFLAGVRCSLHCKMVLIL